jgi:hypothetical protein
MVSYDDESLAVVLMLDFLGYGSGDAVADGPASAVPQRLLGSLLGAGPLRDMGVNVRADLRNRINLLFAEEMLRFAEIADAAGIPDESAAVRLYQATHALENAR